MQNPAVAAAAAGANGLFSLPPGAAGAAPGAANAAAAMQNNLLNAAAAAGSTGNPLLDAYSQYAALAQYAAQTNAAGPQQTLDMQQQQQQTGEGVGRVCLLFGL